VMMLITNPTPSACPLRLHREYQTLLLDSS
jgi:hypothetical protein